LNGFDEKLKLLVLEMALKIADVGHMSAPFDIHTEWSRKLEKEFFAQGDMEKQLRLEISPLMDRDKPGALHPENQVTFADVIVIPMLESWAAFAPQSGRFLLAQVMDNRAVWRNTSSDTVVCEL